MPIKLRRKLKYVGGAPRFDKPTITSRAKRTGKGRKRPKTRKIVTPLTATRTNDPAVAIWDLLKPFRQEEKSINLVLDCIGKTGVFEQSFQEHPNMSVSEVLKLAIAKFVLQTTDSTQKSFNFQDFYETVRCIENKEKDLQEIQQKRPVIRPTFKERYEAKILKSSNALNRPKSVRYDVPKKVLKRYSSLLFEERLLRKILRPQIYMDFDIKTDRNIYSRLGRIVFQLFTEACPGIVLELVRMCSLNRFRFFTLRKIFKNIWMECEFKIDKSPILEPRYLDYNSQVLAHSSGSGILSFLKPCVYHSANRELINFIVSFSPLRISASQQRIPFGVVHKGHWILSEIQKLASAYGKPTSKIRITKCGAINYA